MKKHAFLNRFLENHLSSSMFSYQEIFSMLMPLILDSVFMCTMSILSTSMISSSSQESVSAVSLVGPLYMLIYAVFNAISAGGTVIVAQLKGCGKTERLKTAAGQLMLATPISALIACVILIAFSNPLVHFLFHGVEETVLIKAEQYLVGIAISMVFLAVYMSGFAVFRGLGETKLCLRLTVIINLLHFIGSFVFINLLKLDILGSVLALNTARFVGGAAAIWMLLSPRSILRVEAKHIFHLDTALLKEIFRIGIPFGMEQLFMNGGTMLVQIYMAQLGTVNIAANAVANSALSLVYAAPSAVCNLAVTIIGQCIGAGEKEMATKYGKRMIHLGTAILVLSMGLLLPLMPYILKLYQAPDNTLSIIYSILTIACICMPFFWPMSTIMPNIMRSAGDAAFASYFSLITMWVIRVGLGYLLAIPMGFGLNGIWICMCLEWAVRTFVFYLRFRSGKWMDYYREN